LAITAFFSAPASDGDAEVLLSIGDCIWQLQQGGAG